MIAEDFYWYWLNNIEGIGRRTIGRLLERFLTPEEIYHAGEREITDVLQHKKMVTAFVRSKEEKKIIDGLQALQERKVTFIHPDSVQYPERLRTIPDMPYGLYLKGTLPNQQQKAVAIIGARSCTRYGKEMARFFGKELAKQGVAIISGLARGIDGMAHEGALEAEGYTLGVLGSGIDQVYPFENQSLFLRMEQVGGILSESNIGVPPTAGLFPQRNRLIAGCADGILVVEAMEKSGTFITVDQGLDQGKDIFALPGRIIDPKCAGCNRLIKLGAHMVTEVDDILEILKIERKNPPEKSQIERSKEKIEKLSLAPLEKMVYSCLQIEPIYLDDIISELRIAPQEVCMALNKLVLCGVVTETARNYYAIKL